MVALASPTLSLQPNWNLKIHDWYWEGPGLGNGIEQNNLADVGSKPTV